MPYGLEKEHDTPENNAWMEKCVDSIKGINKRTGEEYTIGEKVAICKWQLKRMDYKTSDNAVLEDGIRELEEKMRSAVEKHEADSNNIHIRRTYHGKTVD